jgi:lipopolysaccharide transport system ATP-binding protein
MGDTAVRVNNLGKMYRIGAAREKGDGLRHALEAGVRRLGQRLRGRAVPTTTYEDFWALKDVSFEVKRGECVGVIGRNGAGKSTLLKVLSRITEPTRGEIALRGRVGSLLEVGTGFHPELTGRENIFLNGAILGMQRTEIARKFDEIVAFGEVEKFLETPVKYYSSGMYTRLAFSVAAHLEPDILIVDEVLAVGDAKFQKKCLGKMGEVSKYGRTVLFVSHNMQAVATLTQRCIVLSNGSLTFSGNTAEAVGIYNAMLDEQNRERGRYLAPQGQGPINRVRSIRVLTSDPGAVHHWGKPITFEFELEVGEPNDSLCFAFNVVNRASQKVCHFWNYDPDLPFRRKAGIHTLRLTAPKFRLYMGEYTITTWLAEKRGNHLYENINEVSPFSVTMLSKPRTDYEWHPDECVYLENGEWSIPATPS